MLSKSARSRLHTAILLALAAASALSAGEEAKTVESPHIVRTTKFTVDDPEASSAFYQSIFSMAETSRYVAEGRLVEPFVGFVKDEKIGLLAYTEREEIEKSSYPVAVIYTAEFDAVVERLKSAGRWLHQVPREISGDVRVGITRDPSGNALEFVERSEARVAGARLIVDDLNAAEQFFADLFDVEPDRRLKTDQFDESFLPFGGRMYVALYQPTSLEGLPRSQHPVVAIYSTEFDEVLRRTKAGGHEHTTLGESLLFVEDPSGNVVEVVRQRE